MMTMDMNRPSARERDSVGSRNEIHYTSVIFKAIYYDDV